MKLEVQEATPSDIEAAKAIYGPETGDLCAPIIPVMWSLTDSHDTKTAKLRAEWSCQQQRDILEDDPTTRFVKVVDADNDDELVAFGRWHRYPSGYHGIKDLECVGRKDRNNPATWSEDFNKDFYLGFLDPAIAARTSWMGMGHYWVLTTIKTREPLQKNGAGSLILKWGLARAAKEGVPAYLEAVVDAMHLYETHGFREVGRQKVDCTPYGMLGVELEVARMRADPR